LDPSGSLAGCRLQVQPFIRTGAIAAARQCKDTNKDKLRKSLPDYFPPLVQQPAASMLVILPQILADDDGRLRLCMVLKLQALTFEVCFIWRVFSPCRMAVALQLSSAAVR
jgi:hypothetical protein